MEWQHSWQSIDALNMRFAEPRHLGTIYAKDSMPFVVHMVLIMHLPLIAVCICSHLAVSFGTMELFCIIREDDDPFHDGEKFFSDFIGVVASYLLWRMCMYHHLKCVLRTGWITHSGFLRYCLMFALEARFRQRGDSFSPTIAEVLHMCPSLHRTDEDICVGSRVFFQILKQTLFVEAGDDTW